METVADKTGVFQEGKKFVAYNKEINTEVELFLLNKIYHYI